MHFMFQGHVILMKSRECNVFINACLLVILSVHGGGGSSTGPWPCLSSTGPWSGSLSLQVHSYTRDMFKLVQI